MESLLYTSEPTRLCDEAAVAGILDAALRNNPRLGLTGMLLWSERMFAQLVEGPPASLDLLLERLRADDRHRRIRVIYRARVDERFFPDWSMASRRLRPEVDWPALDEAPDDPAAANGVWLLHLMAACRRGGAIAAPPPAAVHAGSPS
jgi:hypothetical protein